MSELTIYPDGPDKERELLDLITYRQNRRTIIVGRIIGSVIFALMVWGGFTLII